MKFKGLLLQESLKNTEVLKSLTITKEEKWDVNNATNDQPKQWTAIYYEGEEKNAAKIAGELGKTLREGKWYTNFATESKEFVIFPGKVFAYEKGDKQGVEDAKEFGRSIGIPESQLDWT